MNFQNQDRIETIKRRIARKKAEIAELEAEFRKERQKKCGHVFQRMGHNGDLHCIYCFISEDSVNDSLSALRKNRKTGSV